MAYFNERHDKIGTPEIIKEMVAASDAIDHFGYKKLDDPTDDEVNEGNVDDIGKYSKKKFWIFYKHFNFVTIIENLL